MAEPSSLEGLQNLHRDLVALCENRLPNLERLWIQLQDRVEEFRKLLDKPQRNEVSRKSLATGKLKVLDLEYDINEEFQQGALQLADALNLDEIEAAAIFIEAQEDAEALGRSLLESAVLRFHQRRKYLLDSLRLVLQHSVDPDADERNRDILRDAIIQILQVQESSENSSKYVRKCLTGMTDIKQWLQSLAEKMNSAAITGQGLAPEVAEIMEYQRVSLVQQHECLGVVTHYLIKANHASFGDFEQLLQTLKKVDRYDNLLVHYFPSLAASITAFGAPEGMGSLRQARALNQKLTSQKEQDPWTLQYLHAAVSVWWMAEYSGWYMENPSASPLVGINLDDERKQRDKQFGEFLKDGAFDFLLSLSADVKTAEWYDSTQHGLRQWLQRKAPALMPDPVPFSDFFQLALMEQFESFVDACITNMPDFLRQLRHDEDEQRQLSQNHEHDLDLERFIVIISFACEGRPDAAQMFWADPDSNLAGFLNWVSKRASTPLVSAFCAMLQAISGDEYSATEAHNFLLADGAAASGKLRRNQSLSWAQIFEEFEFFSNKIRERLQPTAYRPGKPNNDQAEIEPESSIMLQSYLQLVAQLSRESQAVRLFLLQNQTNQITDMLYELASSAIPSQLRACAFATLEALLNHKNKEIGEHIWTTLDLWIAGHYVSPPNTAKTQHAAQITWSTDGIFQEIGSGFEEPTSFIHLLNALVKPCEDDEGLNDGLPFPESLGASSRMPGIDPYIDFAIGQVFASTTTASLDPVQLRILRLSCLDFIGTCLDTFNEDLVIFANQSNINVEAAMKTTNLEDYVMLHPFSRVMEWIFNDKVMKALFQTSHQEPAEVGNASPDSPLVLSVLRSIEIITIVMELQATYLDIVRPALKERVALRRIPVANAAFSAFEDGVLNNLSLISDLGLYCGAGHSSLTIASLKLLEMLSTSPKLIAPLSMGFGRRPDRNKAIAAMEANGSAEGIARALSDELISHLDIDQGPDTAEVATKTSILSFVDSCLEALPNRPTVAHLLLGFQCQADTIDIDGEGPFALGRSLFHNILTLAVELPVGDEINGVVSWLVSLRYRCFKILHHLWNSPLTSGFTMKELRDYDLLPVMCIKEQMVRPETLWDGLDSRDPDFFTSTGAAGLSCFLRHRAALTRYIASELRLINREKNTSQKSEIIATLLGSTTLKDGQQIDNITIFEMFDFMELEIGALGGVPILKYFKGIDLSTCLESSETLTYDLRKLRELLDLRKSELRNTGQLSGIPTQTQGSVAQSGALTLVRSSDESGVDTEADMIIGYLHAQNQLLSLKTSRLTALTAWVQLMLMVVEAGSLDETTKTSFVMQALEIIMPRLERYSNEDLDVAKELARLCKGLIFSLDFASQSSGKGKPGDLTNDKLAQLFRISLRAIHSPITDAIFKQTLYDICFRYLTGMSDIPDVDGTRSHNIRIIREAGERLLNVICDDALVGEPGCRLSALLLLAALVNVSAKDNSTYVIECLVRVNFIGILVESLQHIPLELRESTEQDLPTLHSYHVTKIALLLQISQTKYGATAVLNAGLFQSIKESQLFSTDPDLGPDFEGPSATKLHYKLLVSLMRVINAAVLIRGPQNEQTMTQGRKFLSSNRGMIVEVFKQTAGLRDNDSAVQDYINQLAEAYVILISHTGFLEFEDQSVKPVVKIFT